MRTGTGVVDAVLAGGTAKVRMNRNNLYMPCSGMIGENNALIDAKNHVGAVKGQYVKLNIPDGKMGIGGAICFGVPLLMVIICGIFGYRLGAGQGWAPELSAFGGMIGGGIIGAALLRLYDKTAGRDSTMAEITEILVEQTIEMDDTPGQAGKKA